jgi:hypothetical protein
MVESRLPGLRPEAKYPKNLIRHIPPPAGTHRATVSNVLKTRHDTVKNSIGNIR